MFYTIPPRAIFEIFEDSSNKEYLQMDQIMKKLFTLQDKRPIIDFLNAIYDDGLSYDAKLSYSNTEIINTKNFSVQYVSFHADMFITVEEGNSIFEYAIEFQTAFDKDITIRMFRYSFERAIRLDYYRDKNTIKLSFPEPYMILLEEEKDLHDEITMEIHMPKKDILSFKVNVLKYWNYNLSKLYEQNMYLLYPLQIFSLRRELERLKGRINTETERKNIYEQIKSNIVETVKAIDKAYKDAKIDIRTYDEMTTVLLNLNSYLVNVYRVEGDVEEEMLKVVKSLYDPKVEERGIEKGIEKGIKIAAENMIKDGDSNDKIRRCTGLDESIIMEIRKLIEAKGEH